ncbi:hypothetical protein PAM_497 [Onion yellows phytoplasma OY-M]|uniref:Uncharacterized protein n=1 Tax=Onion yellows phytoplasma (strain OY-M) TaxID=262768 RepID=Q6YQ78_ONYPE|nr:hypothetical protein PAM_497 [Onion yellows phytoplasma OY-M]
MNKNCFGRLVGLGCCLCSFVVFFNCCNFFSFSFFFSYCFSCCISFGSGCSYFSFSNCATISKSFNCYFVKLWFSSCFGFNAFNSLSNNFFSNFSISVFSSFSCFFVFGNCFDCLSHFSFSILSSYSCFVSFFNCCNCLNNFIIFPPKFLLLELLLFQLLVLLQLFDKY